jgi:putative hemolysin
MFPGAGHQHNDKNGEETMRYSVPTLTLLAVFCLAASAGAQEAQKYSFYTAKTPEQYAATCEDSGGKATPAPYSKGTPAVTCHRPKGKKVTCTWDSAQGECKPHQRQ